MKLTELNSFAAKIVEIANRYAYQTYLNQFRSAYAQIQQLTKTAQTPQKTQQLNQYRQQTQTSKASLLSAIEKIQGEIKDLRALKIAHQINIDRFFGDAFINLINEINESNIETYYAPLTQIYTQFTQLMQLSSILSTFNIATADGFEEDVNRLDILFDGAAMVKTLKELSKESANWNQHIHCFSRLARENDTDANINSVEKGSLLLTVTLASGTIIAIMKAVDKVLDTIMKTYEVKKKSVELKKLKLTYIDDAINLLDKHAKLNINREAEEIADNLMKEYKWDENNELYNETKTATKMATKEIMKFINSGGKVDGHIRNNIEDDQKKVIEDVKTKNDKIKEIELQIKALSEAKETLLLEEGEEINENETGST